MIWKKTQENIVSTSVKYRHILMDCFLQFSSYLNAILATHNHRFPLITSNQVWLRSRCNSDMIILVYRGDEIDSNIDYWPKFSYWFMMTLLLFYGNQLSAKFADRFGIPQRQLDLSQCFSIAWLEFAHNHRWFEDNPHKTKFLKASDKR